MKKLSCALFAAVLLAGCANNKTTVEGTVNGREDGKVYLVRYDQELIRIDSTEMKDGKFTFQVASPKPEQLIIEFEGVQGRFGFISEPGTVTVDFDFKNQPKATAGGTPSNILIEEFKRSEEPINEERSQLIGRYRELTPADSLEIEQIIEKVNALEEKQENNKSDFIRTHNNTVAAAYLLSSVSTYGYTHQQMDSLIGLLGKDGQNNRFVDQLIERRETLAKVAVGQKAPDFTLPQPDGTPFTLSSLEGKTVLIDFWASWCGPCRRENPNVVRMYNKYKDHGFDIVGVSLDTDRKKWLQAIEDDQLTWHHVSEVKGWDNQTRLDYGVIAIPHTVLIGPDGTILGNVVFGEELETLIVKSTGYTEE